MKIPHVTPYKNLWKHPEVYKLTLQTFRPLHRVSGLIDLLQLPSIWNVLLSLLSYFENLSFQESLVWFGLNQKQLLNFLTGC